MWTLVAVLREVDDLDQPADAPVVPGSGRPARVVERLLDRLAWSPYPKAIVLYLVIRTASVQLLALLAARRGMTLSDRLTAWDGQWYLRLAVHGYADLPGTLDAARQPYSDAPMAFFPLYPKFVEAVMWLGVDVVSAALTVSVLAGLVLACGLVRIGRAVSSDRGDRPGLLLVALWAGAPMAIVFSMAYTEAVFCAFAVWALVGVLERRWVPAGLCAFAAGLSRSTAVVLVAVVVIAALVAAFRRAEERLPALLGAVVAPLGVVGYLGFVAYRTGSWTGWQDIELRGWNTEFDFGVETWESVLARLTADESVFSTLTVLFLLGAVALAVVAVCTRVPWPLTLYGLGVLLLAIGTRGLPDAKIRFILPAFPVLIPIAVGLSKRRTGTAVAAVVAWVVLGAWFSAHALTAWRYAI
ncbi:hypothetical protein AVL48_26135 [Amycolatopsis regifaucium]|uniref:Integral membrane protein n=1 Tax=Amycolatopsis regifaucium TaxID=546365 RepID=A0A154MQI6_9PSEU|nr:hypothetical protein AVL48_26135 [Amycolatopsis regifaucium]OKA03470.1 hypothetical protein ATP06_0235780 [Amycolatopsis regifaucium]